MSGERWDQLSPDQKAHQVQAVIAVYRTPSSRDIAMQLGTTRNAVIGVCHRNGIVLPLDNNCRPKAPLG